MKPTREKKAILTDLFGLESNTNNPRRVFPSKAIKMMV
jgi:hypothetical protein